MIKHTVDYEKNTPYSRPKREGINANLNQIRLYLTYKKQVNTIVSHYRSQAGNNYSFLDVGCGSGEFLRHLSEFIPANLLMGLELDCRLVNESQERCGKVKIYEGSAEVFPFLDSSLQYN